MRDTEETPKKEDLLQGVWLCPPRHNYHQLLWLKTEFKFCFIRLSDTLGKLFPSSLFQLEKKNGKDLNVLFTITFRKLENSGGFRVIEGQRAATPVAPWLFDPEIMQIIFVNSTATFEKWYKSMGEIVTFQVHSQHHRPLYVIIWDSRVPRSEESLIYTNLPILWLMK